jgi:2-keto-4-pentenoate hydratase/2-oxohepta-3-ene-1,7-dioic acid hydratase in catechol pathway
VLIREDGIVDIATASGGSLPDDPQAVFDHWDELRALAERVSSAEAPLERHDLLAPVPRPRQVFAIGLNYAAHAAEAGLEPPEFPPTFTKFPTCLTGPEATVELPSEFVDWEVELVVVIGRRAYEVAAGDGWTCRSGSCRPDRRPLSSASASRSPGSGRSARGSSAPTS